ncbi:hypothetical protein Tco_1113634 [Tanacetum coccineum]|uniref:Uncharacterized protein n=1 Tax=Tanacetum coccineum TaxID=301880 RepID=A0ABQ5ISQ7_9ASTR
MQREKVAQEEASNAALIAESDNVQARMEADALLAARLREKEREQISIDEQARLLVETIAERKRFFVVQRAEQIRNKPPTKIQLRNKMITYLKNMEGGKKAASSKKRSRAEPDEESVKRQKIRETSGLGEEQLAKKEKELSEEELQKLLVVVPVEEVYVEALQVKYPIIDWEVYSEDTRRYWRIIRVGNHTEAYQIFADMLKKFDRDDLVKLWDLVKKRFSTTEPTDDKEKELWVELKRLFEPDNDDILWKLQRYMHDPLVWRLYDTCGVHHVSSVRGHDIFMLVEKEYPLTRGTLGLMMVARLLVEADSEMSRELLRKIFYQANRPRQNDVAFGLLEASEMESSSGSMVVMVVDRECSKMMKYGDLFGGNLFDEKMVGNEWIMVVKIPILILGSYDFTILQSKNDPNPMVCSFAT